MKQKKTKQADLENFRNLFFLIGLIISLGAVLLAFEWKSQVKKVSIPDLNQFNPVIEDPLPPVIKERNQKQKIKKPVDVFIITEEPFETDLDIFSSEPGVDLTFDDFYNYIYAYKEEIEEEIPTVNFAEEMPEFPGGDAALLKFIANSIKYPIIAQENGIFGKVYISFIVDIHGKVTKAHIARGVDLSLNNEALRVINSMPQWKPGRQGGKSVNVRYTVPINFVLQ